ncbi:hypothetical protein JA1_004543 [Spathaspora sp. JA1]|nr:hypothetical protein JA1_004543 [Spathaspora sp. JA1]
MSSIKFHQTNDPEKIKQIYTLCGSEWSGKLSPEEYGKMMLVDHLDFTNERGGKLDSYYLEDTTNGKIVSCTTVRHVDGFYKPGRGESNVISCSNPDANLFGVKNIVVLLVGYVFTDSNYRGKGYAERCISSAIQYTERDIVNVYMNQRDRVPDHMNIDNFRSMVSDQDGNFDQELANYYLSKHYVWMLYSGVATYYQKFGFKGYPLDFYKIPTSMLTESQEKVVVELIKGDQRYQTGTETPTDGPTEQLVGKRLKLLKGDNESDQDIIKFILQTKELQIITELNKLTYNSKLHHSQKSGSSLINMKEALSMSPDPNDLHPSEGSKSEDDNPYPSPQSNTPGSSSQQNTQTIPKVAIKPSYDTFQWNVHCERHDAMFKYNKTNPGAVEFTNIQGAIITNDLQHRSYYILWNTLMHTKFFILGMGEIEFQQQPGSEQKSIRRGSSLGSLSIMNDFGGGFNFQDFDILLSTAIYVAKQRHREQEHILIAVNDLPDEIPEAVMYDFFMNYLEMTRSFYKDSQESNQEAKDRGRVEHINNAAKQLELLPMLKQFGSNSHEFELDWIYSGMWSWG